MDDSFKSQIRLSTNMSSHVLEAGGKSVNSILSILRFGTSASNMKVAVLKLGAFLKM